MIEIPQKHCPLCGNDYPETAEYFYQNQQSKRSSAPFRRLCKECWNIEEAKRKQTSALAIKAYAATLENMNGSAPQKHCPSCDKDYPATSEYFYLQFDKRRETVSIRNLCKPCWNSKKKVRALVSGSHLSPTPPKQIIGTPDQCGCCGAENVNILGDVNDETREQYGYLCFRCYKLIGSFHTDPARMKKALCYIEKTRKGRV